MDTQDYAGWKGLEPGRELSLAGKLASMLGFGGAWVYQALKLRDKRWGPSTRLLWAFNNWSLTKDLSAGPLVAKMTKPVSPLPIRDLWLVQEDGSLIRGTDYEAKLRADPELMAQWDARRQQCEAGRWRSFDGFMNNLDHPWLGQGGHPYAMTWPPKRRLDPARLPDAEQVVRELFERERFRPAPNGQNAMIGFLATIVTHEFFRTDAGRGRSGEVDRPWINNNSSYIDLSLLYGNSKARNDEIRTFEGGKLIADVLGDTRIERLPSCRAIMILFGREHNYICEQLAAHYPEHFDTDEKLFQQARLINNRVFSCAFVNEYLGGLLVNQSTYDHQVFTLDDGRPFSKCRGAHMSVEFNLLYRWHFLLPNSYNPAVVAIDVPTTPSDIELDLLYAMLEPGGAFGPRNCASWLLPADVAALRWSRRMGVSSFNEMRQNYGLEPLRSFSEFSSIPGVNDALARLYGNVDDVELWVGCMCEDSLQDAKNRCAGYGLPKTVAKCILMDALNAVFYDRYATLDCTECALTPWGYAHASKGSLRGLISRHTKLELPDGYDIIMLPDAATREQLERQREALTATGRTNAHQSAFAMAALDKIDLDDNGVVDYHEGYRFLDHLRVLMNK